MPCNLCNKDHDEFNCVEYISVPQPLKEMLYNLFDRRSDVSVGDTSNWIYDNIYAPSDDNSSKKIWTQETFAVWMLQQAAVEERIYMCVKSKEILNVWKTLLPHLENNPVDVGAAKYCHDLDAAESRHDTIVIWLRNKAAVWRVLDTIRDLRSEGKINDSQFKASVPMGTGQIRDLPGVATALQPVSQNSFGGELCDTIATAFDKLKLNWPNNLDKIKFAAFVLKEMKEKGFNICKPWSRPMQVYGVEYVSI